ncbi:MAG: hypothetical protein L3J03_01325 [Desulfobacterales bacterium]|nr:hypothetical protein [Desulfobacterales bacterium]
MARKRAAPVAGHYSSRDDISVHPSTAANKEKPRTMQPSFEDILTFEIKKEMADRYFGFRRMIEEDKEELARRVKEHSLTLEQKICIDLVRIYLLLGDEKLIQEFLDLVGLEEKLFYDPYLLTSATLRKRLLGGLKVRGLTRAGRYRKLVFNCYEMLEDHVQQYREKLGELVEERETINQEIKLFYRKNDISAMMGFFRTLNGSTSAGTMEGGLETGFTDSMEKKMRLAPVPPIEQLLPIIPPLMPLAAVRNKLSKLIERGYKLQSAP